MSTIKPRQGDVWIVQFDPSIGDEIGKSRPAVVLSNQQVGLLELRFVCPITDWKERYNNFPWVAKLAPNIINGLAKSSGADTFQCKSLSLRRFHKRIGKLTAHELSDVLARLSFCLRIL